MLPASTFRRPVVGPPPRSVESQEAELLRSVILALVEQHPTRRMELAMSEVQNPRRELRARVEGGVLVLTSERRGE